MRTITVDVPDDLADRLTEAHERLPELLAFSLQQPALSAQLSRTLLTFLTSAPTPAQIAAFAPSPELQHRLQLGTGAQPRPRPDGHRACRVG